MPENVFKISGKINVGKYVRKPGNPVKKINKKHDLYLSYSITPNLPSSQFTLI